MVVVRRLAVIVSVAGPLLVVILAAWWTLALPSAYTAAGTLEIDVPVQSAFLAVSAERRRGTRWGPGFEDFGAHHGIFQIQAASHYPHEVLEMEAPSLFVTSFLPGAPVQGRSTWTFEALGPRTTRVTLVHEGEVADPFARARLGLTRDGQADVRDQLDALRASLAGGESS